MSDQQTLQIEPRTGVGSHQATKVRRQGQIPAILYGHGESQPIMLNAQMFRRQVVPEHYGSAVVTLKQGDKAMGSAIVKSVQTNPLKGQILHVDLQRVSADDFVNIALPIVLTGDPTSARAGGVLDQSVHMVNIRCRVANVPTEITYDITNLEIGDPVHAGQLTLPTGSELLDKPDEVIAVILAPSMETPENEASGDLKPDASGPVLTGEKEKDSFPPER